jgi:hypothetical protein
MCFKLLDIKLGENDAKREIIVIKNFEEYYYDYNNISKEILTPTKFVVIGKKGTGKTLLAEYTKKQSLKDFNWFCRSETYKKFSLTELKNLENGAISTEQYISIWKWVILIELSKMVILNVSLETENGYKILEKFLIENEFENKMESFKTISLTKEKEFALNSKWFGVGQKESLEQKKKSYIELIEPLENLLIDLLSNKESTYTLLLDELDDKFDGSQSYKNSMICLLKSVEELNFKFYENNIKFKVILLIRDDILNTLEYCDLNKIKEGSSIFLDWGLKDIENSPLLELVTKKIRISVPMLKNKTHQEILAEVFRKGKNISISKNKKVSPPIYILSRTMHRPRDIINFFNKIIKEYPNRSKIEADMILNVESKYSSYLHNEIMDELVGHLKKEVVTEFFQLLKNFGKTEFKEKYLKIYFTENHKNYKQIKVEMINEIIGRFYIAGAVGTKKFNKNTGKYHFSWHYKDEGIYYYNNDEEICVHNGLRKNLNLR